MTSKKAMVLITILSLVLVFAVVIIVHEQKPDETETVPITADSIAIGTWETESASASAEGEEKTMNDVSITLEEDGSASGYFGKYDFVGTWQQVSDSEIRLVKKNDDPVYKGVIDPEDEDTGNPVMDLAAIDVTDSKTWTLVRL